MKGDNQPDGEVPQGKRHRGAGGRKSRQIQAIENLTPAERRSRLAGLQRQRAGIQGRIDSGTLSGREANAASQSLRSLDRQIELLQQYT